MAWRKWFVRSFVFTVVSCCAAAGYTYQQWTNPAAVREQVLAKLKILFSGADVAVDSARLALLGHIEVGEARLSRRDDPDGIDAIHIPSAQLYHDKEKLLEGELPLRKVVLFQPRFRAYRNKDGKWNLQGLLGEQRLDRLIPTVIVHHGTILLEDRTTDGNIHSLEVTDVNVKLINDPLPTLKFDGTAQSPLIGNVTIEGTLQRASGELILSIKTKDTPLGAKLLQRISPFCPKDSLRNLEVEGKADFEAKIESRPGQTPSLHYNVGCTVRKTKVKHPSLPLPLEDLEARASLVDGVLTVERAQARGEWARINARGAAQFPDPEKNFAAHIDIDGLLITDEIIKRLPDESAQNVVRDFHPQGRIGAVITLAKRDGEWVSLDDGKESAITISPDKISIAFERFRYPVRELSGTIEYPLASKKLAFRLTGKADGQEILMRGHALGNKSNLDLEAHIRTANVSINETLLKALSTKSEEFARSFNAKGKVDAAVLIRHVPGAKEFENRFNLYFHDCDIAWKSFPLPLSRVKGWLDIEPAGISFHNFHGQHAGGEFSINGKSFVVTGKSEPGIDVEIQGKNVALSPALQLALEPMPGLKKVWDTFAPSGAMNFFAVIHRPTDALKDLEVRVEANGATIEPIFFKYRFTDVSCVVHYQKDRLDIGGVSARHGTTSFVLPAETPGWVDLKLGGGYRAELPLLDVTNLYADADFLKALPDSLRTAGELMQLRDPVLCVRTKLVVSQSAEEGSRPEIYWDAKGCWVRNAKFVAGVPIEGVTGVVACRGNYDGHKISGLYGNVLLEQAILFKQPFQNIHADFLIDGSAPNVLLAHVHAPLFGGDITGECRVDFLQPAQFKLNLTAAQIDLQTFGQHNLGAQSQMKGKADGKLYLTGSSAGIASLDGYGSFNVIAAKLYNLPLILDLLKFLGLRWPDSTAFEEVHAMVRIRGPRVNLRKLELQGNAISLSGQGEFNLDGTDLHVEFYPTWGRFEQMSGPAMRKAALAVSKRFLIIDMTGKVTANADDLKFNKRLIPVLIDPIMNARDLFIGSAADPRRTEPISQRPTVGRDPR